MTLRIAIVGCGKIADSHVEQCRATGKAEVVAVCDREPIMAEQLARRFAVPAWFDDIRRLLAEARPDVLHIATPPDSHRAIAELAFEAGCHVFLEKPVAPTAADAAAIIAAAQAANRLLTVNYLYNFESPTMRLQELLAAGAVGDLVHIDSTYGYDLSGDYGMALLSDPAHWVHRLPGGLFHNVLDHVVCKLAMLLPDVDAEVACRAWRRRAPVGDPVVDALADELRFSLAVGPVTVGGLVSAHAKPATHQLRVYGSRNSYELDYGARTLLPMQRQSQPSALGRLFPPWVQARGMASNGWRNVRAFARHEFHFFQGMRVLLDRMYVAVASAGPPPIPYAAIAWSTRTIDRLIVAARPVDRSTPP